MNVQYDWIILIIYKLYSLLLAVKNLKDHIEVGRKCRRSFSVM